MTLHELLEQVRMSTLKDVDLTLSLAKGIALIGALFFVAKETYTVLADPRRSINLYMMMKPLLLALIITGFSTIVIEPLDTIMGSVAKGMSGLVDAKDEIFELKKKELESLKILQLTESMIKEDMTSEELIDAAKESEETMSWFKKLRATISIENFKKQFLSLVSTLLNIISTGVRATIYTITTYFLIILAMFGPFSFAAECYPNWQGTVNHWLTMYVTIWLWVPITDIFTSIINGIQIFMIEQTITELKTGVSDVGLYNDTLLMGMQIVGIIGYLCIPTVSAWLIKPSASAGGYNKALTTAGGGAASKIQKAI